MVVAAVADGVTVHEAGDVDVRLTDTVQLERRVYCSILLSYFSELIALCSDSDKKIHQGWGGDEGKSELKAEEDGSKDAFAESPKPTGDDNAWGAPANDGDGWGAPPADFGTPAQEDTPAETRRGKEEEEDNTLTLDQYLAQQKEKASDVVPKLENVRQANDGAENLFKDAIQVVKGGDEDSYFAGKVSSCLC